MKGEGATANWWRGQEKLEPSETHQSRAVEDAGNEAQQQPITSCNERDLDAEAALTCSPWYMRRSKAREPRALP